MQQMLVRPTDPNARAGNVERWLSFEDAASAQAIAPPQKIVPTTPQAALQAVLLSTFGRLRRSTNVY
jgi:hypothetical protein